MADIIDISTKNSSDVPTTNINLTEELVSILKDYQALDGFLICLKDVQGSIVLFRNNTLDIKDRSYILQLLQSDIHDELAPTMDIEEEDF